MPLEQKPLDDLNEGDLQALVDANVTERKTIEYKSAIPSDSSDEKKEFLADVSSFANSSGGHLIYGIEAKDGMPTKLSGLDVPNADKAVLRLDNMVRDGIQPRIPGHYTKAITLASGRVVMVMRIPHSWNAPHMVTFGNSSRFFARTSNGKYQLDVGEIRSAFLRSETQAEHIRGFRTDRLARIAAGNTPIPLTDAPKLVLHLVPLGAFDTASSLDITRCTQNTALIGMLMPLGAGGSTHRYNFDGFLTLSRRDYNGRTTAAHAYTQLFRNGCIEGVNSDLLELRNGEKLIPSVAFEKYSMHSLRDYLKALERLGVVPPYFAMLSFVGVEGYEMAVSSGYFSSDGAPIDQDMLIVPETLIESPEDNLAQILKPSFDAVWNAAGWPRSHNYDEQGNRIFR